MKTIHQGKEMEEVEEVTKSQLINIITMMKTRKFLKENLISLIWQKKLLLPH